MAKPKDITMAYDPNPFSPHPEGAWHDRIFPEVKEGIRALLERFDNGIVTGQMLRHGKDNDAKSKRDTLSYWLYYQHHPGHERWKLLGQRYWSVQAWKAWKDQYTALPFTLRNALRDGLPALKSFPKRGTAGPMGLVSEHVVPKKVMKELILDQRLDLDVVLPLNICCVVTVEEDRRLVRDKHPYPFEPWKRYEGLGIELLFNEAWSEAEIAAIERCNVPVVRNP